MGSFCFYLSTTVLTHACTLVRAIGKPFEYNVPDDVGNESPNDVAREVERTNCAGFSLNTCPLVLATVEEML